MFDLPENTLPEQFCAVELSYRGLKSIVSVDLKVIEDCFSVYEPTKLRGLTKLADSLAQNYFELEGWVPEIQISNLKIDNIYDSDSSL